MRLPVVLDLETKHTFREFSEHEKLGVTVVGVYDYKTQQKNIFTEKEINALFPILEQASYIVGYNIDGFDMPVLAPYYPGNILTFKTFDILEDIRIKIGRRIALNDVARATLGKEKSGHGLMAIDYYREGKWDELKKYCLDDVMVTKELFDFGEKFGEIFYLDENGKVTIKVDWKKYLQENTGNDTHMILPF